jgi:hypothetical protein
MHRMCVLTPPLTQVELSSEDKVGAAKEQGRALAAAEIKALQEELQRMQLRRTADADAARKVPRPPPSRTPHPSTIEPVSCCPSPLHLPAPAAPGLCCSRRLAGRASQHNRFNAHVTSPCLLLHHPPPASSFPPCSRHEQEMEGKRAALDALASQVLLPRPA